MICTISFSYRLTTIIILYVSIIITHYRKKVNAKVYVTRLSVSKTKTKKVF